MDYIGVINKDKGNVTPLKNWGESEMKFMRTSQVMKLRKAGKFSGRKQKGKPQNHRSPFHQLLIGLPTKPIPRKWQKCVSHVGIATIFQTPKLVHSPKILNT